MCVFSGIPISEMYYTFEILNIFTMLKSGRLSFGVKITKKINE